MDIINLILSIVILIDLMLIVVSSVGHSNNADKDFVYKVYVVNVGTIVWWIASMGFCQISTTENATFLTKNLYVSATFIASSFYYFSLIFPETKTIYLKQLIKVLSINLLLIYIITFSDYIIIGATPSSSGEIITFFGIYYWVYPLYILYFFCTSFIRLFIKYIKSSSGIKKSQIFYVFLGYTLSGIIAFQTNLLLPSIHNFKLIWLGPTATICLATSITYAVKKYRLFNVKIIAVQLFVFALWVFTLIRMSTFGKAWDGVDATANPFANVVYFIFVLIIGIILIISVEKEVRQRERNELLVRELSTANEQLKEVSELKNKFVSLATHQMASPLTAMKVYAAFLKDGGNAEVAKNSGIERIADSFISIVSDFLDISKLEAGEETYIIERCNILELIKKSIEACTIRASEKNLKITLTPILDSTEFIQTFNAQADKSKLLKALQSILENSIKYSEPGQGIDVSLSKSEEDNSLRIEISDMAERKLPAVAPGLVKKFSSSNNKFEANIVGNSLGLYAAKQCIERMGGVLKVEQNDENVVGCTFIFSLQAI